MPSGDWKSPRTGADYPLSVEIVIPGPDITLRITSLAEDQEIPVPGPMRAVWEGAGRVQATVQGIRISGRARIELCGYAYIFDFSAMLSSFRRKIDTEILRFFPPAMGREDIARLIGDISWQGEPRVYSDLIAKPSRELLDRNKKYYRPLYAILLLHSLGVSSEPYFDLICTIPELTHTGALIIDDIEDHAPTRRGGPAIHHMFGEDVAINAANTLYYLPWLLVEHHCGLDDSQRLLLYQNMVRSAVKAHLGQGTDIFWSRNRSSEQIIHWVAAGIDKSILQMHADKTGVAGEQVAQGCCVIARSSPEIRDACIRFSRNQWIGFQIMDDVRDILGDSESGKKPGTDISTGKLSYVIARALKMLEGHDRERLAEILALPPQRKDRRVIAEGITLVKKSGAIEACRREVEEMFSGEWEILSKVVPPSESKVLFRAFCRKMLSG
jgi:geranylgeranyl pyrophosphate synthase